MKTLIALTLIWASTAFARIDETEDQITARYGKPIAAEPADKIPERTAVYESGGLRITVVFENGVSRYELFSKPDKSALSQTEINTLLFVNTGGRLADALGKKHGAITKWWSPDGRSRVAFYDEIHRLFFVTSEDYMERSKERSEQTDIDRLKNF